MSTDGKVEEVKAARNRSPNHPSMTLEEAIERAKTLHGVYGRTPIGNALAVAKWGYTNPRSSGALQTLATVKSYGLIDATGLGQAQKVAVTEAAERIIRNAPNRNELVKVAALAPALNKEVWEKYNHELPHDDVIKEYLKWERPEGTCFTVDETVEAYIERLRTTLQYAGLISGNGSSVTENNSGTLDTVNNKTDPETPISLVQVGSYVQWTSNGQHQFTKPRKVVRLQDGWALVEGSNTGVPVSQLELVDPPSAVGASIQLPNPFASNNDEDDAEPKEGTVLVRTILDEGPVTLRWPDELSEASVAEFEYWVNGLVKRARRKAGIKDKPAS